MAKPRSRIRRLIKFFFTGKLFSGFAGGITVGSGGVYIGITFGTPLLAPFLGPAAPIVGAVLGFIVGALVGFVAGYLGFIGSKNIVTKNFEAIRDSIKEVASDLRIGSSTVPEEQQRLLPANDSSTLERSDSASFRTMLTGLQTEIGDQRTVLTNLVTNVTGLSKMVDAMYKALSPLFLANKVANRASQRITGTGAATDESAAPPSFGK